jgi:hypothetical protein
MICIHMGLSVVPFPCRPVQKTCKDYLLGNGDKCTVQTVPPPVSHFPTSRTLCLSLFCIYLLPEEYDARSTGIACSYNTSIFHSLFSIFYFNLHELLVKLWLCVIQHAHGVDTNSDETLGTPSGRRSPSRNEPMVVTSLLRNSKRSL